MHIQGCPYSTDPSGNSITFDRDARSLNDIPRPKNGTVNKQNCRIYATENPQEIQEVPLHDEKAIEDNIREEIAAIPAEMLAKTMENAAWVRRIWATLYEDNKNNYCIDIYMK